MDGKPNKEPENVQYAYLVKFNNVTAADLMGEQYDDLRKELGISNEDIQSLSRLHGYDVEQGLVLNQATLQYDGYMPLTKHAANALKQRGIVKSMRYVTDKDIYSGSNYPRNSDLGWKTWTRDNLGPIWIPAKGKSIKLHWRTCQFMNVA